MTDLERHRRRYAEELRAGCLLSKRLADAFASVPREHYLGPGPWRRVASAGGHYETTESADPRLLYRNELFAIDEDRRLNNGQPSGLATWFNALDLQAGDRVLHVGAGVGYYSAILAHVVGPEGHVVAVEIDAELAERARRNLAHIAHVEVVGADGSEHDPGPRDAIFVNAGATHPAPVWLDSLPPGGRLLLPLTIRAGEGRHGVGYTLLVLASDLGTSARFLTAVGIYICEGASTEAGSAALERAYRAGGHEQVRSLRRDGHDQSDACWLHRDDFCLSKTPIGVGL